MNNLINSIWTTENGSQKCSYVINKKEYLVQEYFNKALVIQDLIHIDDHYLIHPRCS